MERFGGHCGNEHKRHDTLDKFPGLRENLEFLTRTRETLGSKRYTRDEIIQIMADSVSARKAVLDCLWIEPGHLGSDFSKLVTDDLIWGLVEELSARLGRKET